MSNSNLMDNLNKYSWLFPFITTLPVILVGFVLLVQAGQGNVGDTNIAWDSFNSSNPLVADYIVRLQRLIVVSALTVGVGFAYLSFKHLKNQEKWAWYFMWLLAFFFISSSIAFYLNDSIPNAVINALFFGVVVIGQLIPIKSYF